VHQNKGKRNKIDKRGGGAHFGSLDSPSFQTPHVLCSLSPSLALETPIPSNPTRPTERERECNGAVGEHMSSVGGGAEARDVAAGRLNQELQNREPQTLAIGEPEREEQSRPVTADRTYVCCEEEVAETDEPLGKEVERGREEQWWQRREIGAAVAARETKP